MRLQHLAHRQGFRPRVAGLQSGHIGRRRRHGRGENIVEQPLSADCRRRAGRVRGHGQNRRLAQQPPAVLIGERHPAEVGSIDARNSVVPGQLFVEERVLRRQQIHDAPVLLQLSVEEQLHLPHEGNPQVVVKPREMLVRIRREQPHIADLQPLFEKVLHQRCSRARIREHAPHLLIEDTCIPKSPADRQVEQPVVRNAAPQEERQA